MFLYNCWLIFAPFLKEKSVVGFLLKKVDYIMKMSVEVSLLFDNLIQFSHNHLA